MTSICRLCLSSSSNRYDDLNLFDHQRLQLILPEIDLSFVRSPLICSNCVELLTTAYSFKNNCLRSEQIIKSYVERHGQRNVELCDILKEQLGFRHDNDKGIERENLKDQVKLESYDDNFINSLEDYVIINSEDVKKKERDDKQVTLFTCGVCTKMYASKDLLLDHVSIHFRRPKCNVCKDTFSNVNDLKEHSAKKHEIVLNNITDDFDGVEFELDHGNLNEAIKKHLDVYKDDKNSSNGEDSDIDTSEEKEHNSNNPLYKCEICEKVFNEKFNLSTHMKTHFYRLKCLLCNKLFCTIQSFRKHTLATHKNIFKKKLQDIEDLLKIMYSKENASFPNICSICNKSEKDHSCTCKSEISCDTCNKTISKDSYFKHKVVHLIRTNNFDCEYCQKKFMRKSALTRHIEEVHLGIRKQYTPRSIYTCDVCGLTTHRKSRLTQHIRTHTGEKPYKCDECGKAFAQSSQLGVHKRTKHSEHSRFTCEYCSKPLKSKYSLNMHILIMHKPEELERKFGCHICEKKFRFPGELTNHLTWHSEDRRFSCEVCGKRFVNQPSVKKHMVIHSGEKKHKCEICGRGFHHKSYIKVHMKVHKRIM